MNLLKMFCFLVMKLTLVQAAHAMRLPEGKDNKNIVQKIEKLTISLKSEIFVCVCKKKADNIFTAIFHDCCACCIKFIEQGLDINQKIENQLTPLEYAVFHKSLESAELLILNGAHVNKGYKKFTLLHQAIGQGLGCAPIVELLMNQGAYLNRKCLGTVNPGQSPLCYAAAFNCKEIVTLFISVPFSWGQSIHDPGKFESTFGLISLNFPEFNSLSKKILCIFKVLKNKKILLLPKGVQLMIIAYLFDPKELIKQLVRAKTKKSKESEDAYTVGSEEIKELLDPYR